jgi:Lon protease-like protein
MSTDGGPTASRLEMPMFPLGSPLLPGMLLPLRVFEPRYRAMCEQVLGGDGRFGVVLIERGSEVGGGDVRVDVGCVAEVVRAEPLADGGWMLACVGVERIRVHRWLPDDPFPRAEVAPWPDDPDAPDTPGATAAGPGIEVAFASFHDVTTLLVELGVLEDPSIELDDDPAVATYQMALASPLGPLDRHRLLATPSASGRVALLVELLDDAVVLLRARLEGS